MGNSFEDTILKFYEMRSKNTFKKNDIREMAAEIAIRVKELEELGEKPEVLKGFARNELEKAFAIVDAGLLNHDGKPIKFKQFTKLQPEKTDNK